jgi:hypothetical protein
VSQITDGISRSPFVISEEREDDEDLLAGGDPNIDDVVRSSLHRSEQEVP